MTNSVVIKLVATAVLASLVGARTPSAQATPAGMFSITPVQERTCVAVRVAVDSKQALAGIRWYNNDADSQFPVLLVASGREGVPPEYDDGVAVARDFAGAEGGWSEVEFDQPVGSDTGTLYVVFQLPGFEEAAEAGVGPAFGYEPADGGSCVFLSVDGDEWSRLVTDYQLMVDPVYTDRVSGTLALKSSAEQGGETTPEVVPVEVTDLLRPYPNPFNPETRLGFTLKTAGHVELGIYDVRGRRVRRLLSGDLPAGIHEVVWEGDGDSGRHLASGVYFALMKADRKTIVRRMTLVK